MIAADDRKGSLWKCAQKSRGRRAAEHGSVSFPHARGPRQRPHSSTPSHALAISRHLAKRPFFGFVHGALLDLQARRPQVGAPSENPPRIYGRPPSVRPETLFRMRDRPRMTDHATIKKFMLRNYRHFNARSVVSASQGWVDQLEADNAMFLSLAGAMSTAELGISLAEMIRRGKVHAISCTGANLEEDVFNLVAHDSYHHVPNWRALSAAEEMELANQGLNRVTDTCIPEEEAMRKIERQVLDFWQQADRAGESAFPHQFLYRLLLSGRLDDEYQIDPADSWLLAAAQRDLPLFVPGWEDSTLGNMFVASVRRGDLKHMGTVKSGLHYMDHLIDWYTSQTADREVGFFQIGGGIAGDFSICVVPLLQQDLKRPTPLWSYFCQISDSTTSYGSYSGAVPNEKITWGKLDVEGPKFIIESDATIVAPLVFSYVLAS